MNTGKIGFLVLLVYIAATYLIMFTLDKDTVDDITAEDHYFENLGAISLFAASGLYLYSFFLSRKPDQKPQQSMIRKLSYLGFAALFFFGAGEEISWGQRILGLETPEVVSEINNKNEINLHNLDLFGSKNSLPFKVYQVFAFTYTLILPLIAKFSKSAKKWLEQYITLIPWLFGVAVTANLLFSQVVSRLTFLGQPGEIQESNYELTFMCIGIYMVFMLRSALKQRPESGISAVQAVAA